MTAHQFNNKALVHEFRDQLVELISLVEAHYPCETVPFSDSELHWFSKLPDCRQIMLCRSLREYARILNEHVALEAGAEGDSKRLLWRALQCFSIKPDALVFEQLRDDDLIEIYNTDYIQIFRNPKFFKINSHPLEDVLCRPYWELFQRPAEVDREIMKTAQKAMEGAEGIITYNVPRHKLCELGSRLQFAATVQNRLVSKLTDYSGRTVGIINVVRVLDCVPTSDCQSAQP